MSNPKVSIIIPTINRDDCLKETLLYLQKQINVDFEVIIIYQSPITQLNTNSYPDNFYFFNCNDESASAARNIGILNSNSNILLFIDDDVLIDDNKFIFNHFRHYRDADLIGVVGKSYTLNDNSISYERSSRSYNKKVGFLYFPKNFGCNTFVLSGRSNNLSIRKNIAIAVGGMDENYEKGAHREETDFCLRVTRKYGDLIFDPQAKLVHIGNKTGGIRSWNDNDYIKANHNMVGAIYFDFKMAPFGYRSEYIFATLRYLILNKTIIKRPQLYYFVLKRFFHSFIRAYKMNWLGPKYLNPISHIK